MSDNKQPLKEIDSDLIIEESIDVNIVTSLMRNYRNSVEAILELIDNAVDDRRENHRLKIEIYLGSKFIEIINKGGWGMGLKELQNFLKWGRSSKRGKLGRYGQGGKAAMGYLGNSWKLQSSKLGDEKTYIIEENNWRDRIKGRKKYKPKIFEGIIPKEQGEVRIEIKNLSRNINERKLKEALSDYYRMLLEENKIQININSVSIKPLNIPIAERQKFVDYINSKKFHGWIGLLKPDPGLTGGIRCCVLGRKITENEYFGHPDYKSKATLNRLVGEVNVDFLELNLNKTGFDADSLYWQKLKKIMFDRMKPYIDSLLREREEERISEDEKKTHEQASRVWNNFLREYLQEGKKPLENMGNKELEMGQKPPEHLIISERAADEPINSRGDYQPATPPPEEAIGKRKRLKRFLGIKAEPGIIPDRTIRSELKIENNKEVIIVNKIFPAYKKRDGDGLYICETIAIEYAKPEKEEDIDCNEYVKTMNRCFSDFCLYLEKNKIKI